MRDCVVTRSVEWVETDAIVIFSVAGKSSDVLHCGIDEKSWYHFDPTIIRALWTRDCPIEVGARNGEKIMSSRYYYSSEFMSKALIYIPNACTIYHVKTTRWEKSIFHLPFHKRSDMKWDKNAAVKL